MITRACIACPNTYSGPLACPECGEPGEPLTTTNPGDEMTANYETVRIQGLELIDLTDAGCAEAERRGLAIGVDAYGCAFAVNPEGGYAIDLDDLEAK